MCGRYRLSSTEEEVVEFFEAEPTEELRPRYNIAPSQPVPVIRQAGAGRAIGMVRWGLVPFWSKGPSFGSSLINGRSETVLDKPSFREPFAQRRCLVPADGFYEWKKAGQRKQPFHFGMKDESLFAFAGLWDRWESPEGRILESCTILTTTPNELLQDIHDRMPVILHPNYYETWLGAPPAGSRRLTELLVPFEADLMTRYEVSSMVNSPRNDTPACAERLVPLNHLFSGV
jgi:putative SOS response-associated peptidase YedK